VCRANGRFVGRCRCPPISARAPDEYERLAGLWSEGVRAGADVTKLSEQKVAAGVTLEQKAEQLAALQEFLVEIDQRAAAEQAQRDYQTRIVPG
jgi:hypothetical protein